MVAAGATVLMAASGESSSNETENNSSECVNTTDPSKCNNIQCNEQSIECRSRKNLISCSSDKKLDDKKHSYALKSNRLMQRVENKDQHKNLALHKVAHIRETKASRLRAASIVSSNSNTSKRLGVSETSIPSGSQLSANLSTKLDNPISSDNGNTMNPVRERDKSYKRKSYLNRSSNIEAVPSDRLINSEYNERRSTRQSSKQNHISDTILSSDTVASHQTAASSQKKHTESKLGSSRGNFHYNTHRFKSNSSSTVTSLPNTKCCIALQSSKDGYSDSEVSRRVDALTALTKATMERVERLASHSGLSVNHKQKSEIHLTNLSPTRNVVKCANHSANIHTTVSPSKCSILKKSIDEYSQDSCLGRQLPVSILKHKVAENETGQSSSNTSHNTLPVTFSPSVIEPIHKRHGILKKRSSLDESEILRRRSCSPDVSFNENYSEFRPILKNQRRSSLDEIIKRDQSPDPQPTSILKRKTSREDDREDGQIGSPEPQGILKRKSTNNTRSSNATHHVTIATDLTNGIETFEGSEVRPILKKKHSREESSGNDPPSHEPRPILKKKSSTESDEHDDKPKKTILKCSRKSSQDECNYDTDITSPKKLSMLKNRVSQSRSGGLLENDCVKPILKQSISRENEARVRLHIHDTNVSSDLTGNNLFLRKRAQSVGHLQPFNISNELAVVRDKRRSLESNSLCDMLLNQSYLKSISGNNLRSHLSQSNESSITTMSCRDSINSITVDEKLNKENKDKRLVLKKDIPSEQKFESHEFVTNRNCEKNINFYTQMSISKKTEVNLNLPVDESKKDLEASNIEENYTAQRSSSVSAMALHFKNMEENITSKEKSASSNVQHKVSHGIQRYRDRKLQGNDRFNTQPVTLQEVQEAVLQNQRNAASNNEIPNIKAESTYMPDDEYDPSKLSLAERVRLFNQKIIAETSFSSNKATQERYLRRRPGARYKTQPITSEEVEVASRISPLNTVEKLSLTKGIFEESQNTNNNAQLSSGPQTELPKSILKSSAYHSNNLFRTKSPELEGLKLIKSVLKKESEELQQQVSNICDIMPRFNLKTSTLTSSDKCDSNCSNHETTNDNTFLQSKNIDVKQHQYGEKEDTMSKDFYHIRKGEKHDDKESIHSEIEQEHKVPCLTKIISQDKSCKSRTNFNLDEVDNIKKGNVMSQRYNSEDKHLSKNEIPQSSDNDMSSVGSREVRGIIKNEAIFRRRQNALAKQAKHNAALSKSASHYALSSEGASFDITKEKCNATTTLPGLYRSATQTITVSEGISEADGPSMSIADRLAALQRSGNTNWKRRIMSETSDVVSNTTFNKEELTIRQGVLADCLGKLESATEGWKKRIAAPDAIKFTVAGKMKVEKTEILEESSSSLRIEVTNNIVDKKKRPRPERFKGRKDMKDVFSTPSSPSKDSPITIRRSFSEPASDESGEENRTKSTVLATVSVPKVDDETFTSFYTGISLKKCETESFSLDENAFDIITSHSELLGQKRSIQTQKRRAASKNPIKLLASRTDLKTEYTEVSTGIAEKVMRSLNVEKLAKNSALAIEALAGLASTEDFSAITLRNIADANNTINKLRPYKDLMLIMVKGRRHVQARLVEPVANSINSGDTYVLVTKSEVYNYMGKYSNVIEKARAAEIALSIQQNKDLGCQASQIIIINEDKITCTRSQIKQFWNYLGIDTDIDVIDGGHPDEDELYESAIINTNMIYEVKDDELVPLEKYWGAIPKIKMLDLNKILVFDFGSEMYIWTGKRASNNKKKVATHLATELWKEGYDYTECSISPINAASMIGRRNKLLTDIKSEKTRPSWCLFAKLTQHVETVLFREKFLDWPNVAGIIKMKVIKDKDQIDGTIIVEPCNLDVIIEPNNTPVDLNIKGYHLGRGTGWYDDELMKQCTVETASINIWHIDEFSHTLLDNLSNGQFYTGDSYIIRWMYSVTITGRELSGLQSKHSAKGRDRSIYFIWQGKNASLNEQGAAALLTVELDNEQGPQIRVVQGHEPAAFLNLFSGGMVIHMGKKTDKKCDQRWRLYICRGTLESEIFLTEVPCSTRQLRSRGSFLLLDIKYAKIYVWHGTNALPHIRKNALFAANKIKDKQLEEFGLTFDEFRLEILEINEGVEPEEFFSALGGMNKTLYISLKKDPIQDHTPRLFHFSSITKEFKVTEILCPHRAHLPTPFPFLQDELYQVNQPALFLLDNKNEVWIWQGWWPDLEAEDHSGSKAVRWQTERKTTMTMAIQYWESIHPNVTKFPIYLVWAGLEPLQFINLFPTWTYRDDIAELNMQEGRNPGEILNVENELARLTQSTYPPAQLLQRPLPVGVDPTRLELYLSQQHFKELLGISKEEFQELPMWKQVNLKKEKLKRIQIPIESEMITDEIETSITQHFAYLHGVLQNIEKRMIDILYTRNTKCDETNITKIESQLKTHYRLINDVLTIVTKAVSKSIQEVDLQHIINQLKQITDVPLHLLPKTPIKEKKILFKIESNVIEALNKHCTLEIPSIPELSLVRTESLPKNYRVELLDKEIIIPEFRQIKRFLDNCKSSISVSNVSQQSKSPKRVKILKIVNPSHFYVQSVSDQPAYEKLLNDLQSYSHEAICPMYLIHVGEMFMVSHYFDKIEQGKKWYRGVIHKIINKGTETYYDILFIDIGHLEHHVSIDHIRIIPSQLVSIPVYAIKCSLYSISPIDGCWDKTAIETFCKFVKKNETYMMQVMYTTDAVNHVDLYSDYSVGKELFSVRNYMIFANCGVLATGDIHTSDESIQKINLFPKQHEFFYEDLKIDEKVIVKVQYIKSNLIFVTKFENGQDFVDVLRKEMNNYYDENNDNTKLKRFPEKGDICAFSSSISFHKSWYRGIVKSIHISCVNVFSVDYGFSYMANIREIRELPEFFRSSKAQAIKISLANIKPSNNNKKWSAEVNKFIQQNLYHKIAVIIPVEKNKYIYQAHLYINDYSFNTCLVDEGYAVFINPNLICQSSKTKYYPTKRSVMKGLNLALDEQQEYEETSKLMVIESDPFKVSVQIHKLVSPDCIYVSDMLRLETKTKFISQLNNFYSKYYSSLKKDWTKDSVCVVYYEKEKSYFRACILKILPTEKALVSFYDMAIEEEIPIKHIQPLHPIFQKESAFIFKIKLAGLLPCGGTEVWPTISCQKLFEILNENQDAPFFITLAANIENNKEIPVELWMKKSVPVGPLSPDQIEILSINRMLVESGFALPIKGYDAKKEKILAIEFIRQLLETQLTDENEENNIKWSSDEKNMLCSMESNQLDEILMSEIPPKNLEKIRREEAEVREIENIESEKDDKDEIKDEEDKVKIEEEEDKSDNEAENELKDLEDDSTSMEEDEDDEEEDHNKEHEFISSISSKIQEPVLIDWLPALPIKKKTFVAIPTNVDYSGNIYLHPKKEGKKTLQYIESMLTEYCQKVKIKACDKKWKKGDICIAQYHANKLWYRAKVLAILDENTIEVQFVDYGNVEECTIGLIKKKVILDNIPIQAIKCVVKGLIPANGKWKMEDLDKIHVLLVEKECKVTVLEVMDTHLVVSIAISEPTRCNLLYYIIHKLGIDLAPQPTYSDHFKLSQKIQSPIFSDSIIDKSINNITSEIKTDHTMVKINDSTNSECSMKILDSSKNQNDSDDELETNKKEIVLSTPEEISVENYCHPYVPMLIPEDIDTLEVNLCFSTSLTTYYIQINENLEFKVLNDYYNQYILLTKNLQIEAPMQPLIQNLVSNTPCCSLFSDNIWYRCLIKKVIKTRNPNKILVHLWYVDYGNNEHRIVTLEECDLRIMKEEWLSLPIFAIKCQLWNINVDDSLETSKMVIEQMTQKYNTSITLKIKERHENYLFVELYTDKTCTELMYSSLISDGYFQFKKIQDA